MTPITLRIISIITFLLSSTWLFFDFSFEPAVALLASISGIVGSFTIVAPAATKKEPTNINESEKGQLFIKELIIERQEWDKKYESSYLDVLRETKKQEFRGQQTQIQNGLVQRLKYEFMMKYAMAIVHRLAIEQHTYSEELTIGASFNPIWRIEPAVKNLTSELAQAIYGYLKHDHTNIKEFLKNIAVEQELIDSLIAIKHLNIEEIINFEKSRSEGNDMRSITRLIHEATVEADLIMATPNLSRKPDKNA